MTTDQTNHYRRSTKPARLRIVGYTEEGGNWYVTPSGYTFLNSKEKEKEGERYHTNPELLMPGYDFIWSYNWIRICEEIDNRDNRDKQAFIDYLERSKSGNQI